MMLNFIYYFSILVAGHSSSSLSNLCCHLSDHPNLLGTSPLQNSCKWTSSTTRRDCLTLMLLIFPIFHLVLSVLSPLSLWQLDFLKNSSEINGRQFEPGSLLYTPFVIPATNSKRFARWNILSQMPCPLIPMSTVVI